MKQALIMFLLSGLCALGMHAQALPANVQVVGNDIGVEELTVKELRRAMRGEMSFWAASKKAVTVVLPAKSMEIESSQTAQFVVNSPRFAVLQKYWLGKVFEGRANPPIFVRSQDELVEVVSRTPGSIGLLFNVDSQPGLRIEINEE